jgi:hypothetical protein
MFHRLNPPTGVLLIVALAFLLMGLFPGRPTEVPRIQETSRMDPGAATVAIAPIDPWSAAAQLNAVLNAPIAFGLALLVVGLAMWRALEWAYKMRLEKAEFYIKIADLENAKQRAIWETLAEAEKKSAPSTEAREAPPEREGLLSRGQSANSAVTFNLNAARVASSGAPIVSYSRMVYFDPDANKWVDEEKRIPPR